MPWCNLIRTFTQNVLFHLQPSRVQSFAVSLYGTVTQLCLVLLQKQHLLAIICHVIFNVSLILSGDGAESWLTSFEVGTNCRLCGWTWCCYVHCICSLPTGSSFYVRRDVVHIVCLIVTVLYVDWTT